MEEIKKIAIGITGASGSIYAKRLLQKLEYFAQKGHRIDVVFSSNAIDVWQHELQEKPVLFQLFNQFDSKDYYAPFASGSANYDALIICPCSMGTLGRIANGISNDLISRAADVMLKENKKLIVVPRESPLNLIHLRNLTALKEAGATIIPASPSFYSLPKTIEELCDTVVNRVINHAGFSVTAYQWGSAKP